MPNPRLSVIGALICLIAASLLYGTDVQTSAIPLYNTGIAGSSGQDLNYEVISDPGGVVDIPATVVAGGAPTTWAGTDPDCGWIGLWSNLHWGQPGSVINDPTGWYDFQTTFDLSGFNPATVSISGSWAADNYGYIELNGTPTGVTFGTDIWSFETLQAFEITTGFVPGLNRLDFMVYNIAPGTTSDSCGDPVGLVADMSGQGSLLPEPASLGLCGLALLAGCVYFRKRRV
jgi:hypothetical protein